MTYTSDSVERSTVPVVELTGVSKTWKARPRPVLDCVDLTLRAGSRTWIGGPNGVGKTTLLRVVAGLLWADSGIVRINDQPLPERWDAVRRDIGFLPAGNAGMYSRLTTRQHLDLWARLGFVARGQRRERVAETIAAFDLTELADRRADRMSTGQRQRVRIAMALITRPRLVLMDEPRSSLDSAGHQVLDAGLDEVVARGGAVLWCSPTGEEVGMRADHAFVLQDGRFEAA